MSGRTNASVGTIASLAILVSAVAGTTASAQTIEGVEALRGGPEPYREAVARFLDRTEAKIVGGEPAPAGTYPWQVSLGVSWIADAAHAHFCGGSVVEEGWVLTAAHCIDGLSPHDIKVTAGTISLDNATGMQRNVRRILYMRDNYNRSTLENDIALLELFDPLPFDAGSSVSPVPPATPDQEAWMYASDVLLTVSGWGATSEGGSKVATLRFVEVPPVAREDCTAPLSYGDRVKETMICAGELSGGEDSCQGDSGGPLTGPGEDGAQFQVGIVSWGDGCARPRKPGVYTRLSHYRAWAEACMASPDNCPR